MTLCANLALLGSKGLKVKFDKCDLTTAIGKNDSLNVGFIDF